MKANRRIIMLAK